MESIRFSAHAAGDTRIPRDGWPDAGRERVTAPKPATISFYCPLCGSSYRTLVGVKTHFHHHHNKIKECPVCGKGVKTGKSLYALNQHCRLRAERNIRFEEHAVVYYLSVVHHKRVKSAFGRRLYLVGEAYAERVLVNYPVLQGGG